MKIYEKVVIDIETGAILSEDSYEYHGEIAKCCGPTSAEKTTSAQQSKIAGQMSANYSTTFSQQQDLIAALNKSFSPIVAQGPGQQGMTPAELAARNTAAINATAGANRMAQQSAANFGAGEGGGSSSGLTSGIEKQIEGSIASTQASNLSNTENQIQQENYATGRDNYNRATAGLEFLAGTGKPECCRLDS